MNTRTRIIASSAALLAVAALAAALPAYAQGIGASVSTTAAVTTKIRDASSTTAKEDALTKRIQDMQSKAASMISDRINSLNAQLTRIQGMKNVSADEKATFAASIQAEIASLNSLEAQISTDNSTTTLKADVSSITAAFRVYALVEPQTAIVAAADRVQTITGMMTTIAAKLQSRLSSSTSPISSSLQADLTDLNAKITDANTQAQAAIAEVAALKPDNGDKTIMASNTAALKDARSKIKTATKDIQAGRKDIDALTKALKKSEGKSATVSASSTTTVGQ